MGWADRHVAELSCGRPVSFRPTGNSMSGKIESGQLVVVVPIDRPPEVGDIVLCRVSGRQYLHLVRAVAQDGRCQIGNNRGHINGWTKTIYGRVANVSD